MNYQISNVQIIAIKPKDGLVAFASFVLNDEFYFSSVAIHAKLDGSGYRLTYPTKKVGDSSVTVFHPLTKDLSKAIEFALLDRFIGSQN